MILKKWLLVLLTAFLIIGCVGAVSAEDTSSDEVNESLPSDNETLVSAETTQTPILPTIDSFSGNVSSGFAPLAVSFTFSGMNVDSYSLNFGDGTTDSSPSSGIEHTYAAAGEYTANLTAINTNGTVYQTTTITVTSPLAASFTMSPTSGTAPLLVQFTDTSTGSPDTWAWDFSDGNTSSSQNPTNTFSSAGTYVINLTVSKGDTQETASHTITVTAAQTLTNITSILVTGLTAPVYGETPDTSASVSGGGTLVGVSWSPSVSTFGESTAYTATITIQNATGYVFNATKPSVSLNGDAVSSSYVTLNTASQLLNITHIFPATEAKILPVITLSANITTGTVPLPIKFTYTVTNATSTTWTYGDGSSATISSNGTLTHTYTIVGNYTANLTATNVNGTVYKNISITVKKVGLVAGFQVSALSGTAPLTVRFTDTSVGTITSRVWSFGDGTSDTVQNPVHTFTTPGTYKVILTISDGVDSDYTYRTIVVNAPVSATPTQTENLTSLSAASVEAGNLSMIPHPFDIIKEFIHLFYSIFDPINYVMTANESNTS